MRFRFGVALSFETKEPEPVVHIVEERESLVGKMFDAAARVMGWAINKMFSGITAY